MCPREMTKATASPAAASTTYQGSRKYSVNVAQTTTSAAAIAADERNSRLADNVAIAAQKGVGVKIVNLNMARIVNECSSEPNGRAERLRVSEIRCGVNAYVAAAMAATATLSVMRKATQ